MIAIRILVTAALTLLPGIVECQDWPAIRYYRAGTPEPVSTVVATATTVVVGTFQAAERIGTERGVFRVNNVLNDAVLWRVQILVENTLRGAARTGQTIDFAYFSGEAAEMSEGKAGTRMLLLLREEEGIFRMAADDRDCLFSIETGKHTRYHVDRSRAIEDIIMDFVVIPGEGFRPEIYSPWAASWIAKCMQRPLRLVQFLDNLLHSPNPIVRARACSGLVTGFAVRQSCLVEFQNSETHLDGPYSTAQLWRARAFTAETAARRLNDLEFAARSQSNSASERRLAIENLRVFEFSDDEEIRGKARAMLVRNRIPEPR